MGLKPPGNKVPHYLVSGERHNKPKPYPGTGLSISAKEFNDRLARSGYAKGNAIDMIMKDFPRKKFVPGNLVIIESRIPGWFDDGSDMTVLTPGVIRKPKPDDEDYHLDPENCYMVEFLYLGMEMRTATIGKDRIKLRK